MKKFLLTTTILFSCFQFFGQALPEPPNFVIEKQILADDGAYWDYFGKSAALSEDGKTAVFGATRDDDNGLDSGSVYIFEQNASGQWIQTQKLIASDDTSEDEFGFSLAISNNTIIVGAYLDDAYSKEDSGSAYIFEKQTNGTWLQTQKLKASDSQKDDKFGFAVEINDDWAFVGATYEYSFRGATYAFKRNTNGVWEETQKIARSTNNTGDWFGGSISIDNNILIIAAYGDDEDFTASGAVYIYELQNGSSWAEIQKIKASDPGGGDFFGRSAHIANNIIVVGSYSKEGGGYSSDGGAYIFEKNGNVWVETAVLNNPDSSTCAFFGWSVTNTNNKVIIGAHAGGTNNGPGGVFMYEKDASNNWVNTQRLHTGNDANNDVFGFVVAISNETIVVTDSQNDFITNVAGAAYIFSIDTDGDGISDTVENLDLTDENDICDFNFENLNANLSTSTWQAIDCDSDGILNSEELINGTNPKLADSDGDGINDPTDPEPLDPCLPEQSKNYTSYDGGNVIWSSADCDADGFTNGEEITNGTNPYDDPSFGHTVNPNNVNLNDLQLRKYYTSKTTQIYAGNVVMQDSIAVLQSRNKYGSCSYNNLHIFKQQQNGSWLDIQTINPSGDPCLFGSILALDNNVLMLASTAEDFPNNKRRGIIYVYEPDVNGVWNETQKIIPADGEHLDAFGIAIALSGDTVAIRSKKDGGIVYMYERQNDGQWVEKQQIIPSADKRNDWDKIALLDNTMVIASPDDEISGKKGGYVTIYEKVGNTWAKKNNLSASISYQHADFGNEVVISNDLMVIGSPGYRHQEIESGAVYIFKKINGNWVETQMLLNSDRLEHDFFGRTLDLYDNRLVVGLDANVVSNGQSVITNSGIYLFEESNGVWSEQRKITTGTYPRVGNPAVIHKDIIASSGGDQLYIYDLNIDIDTDGDGVVDSKEIVDGTDPHNRCSYLVDSRDLTLSSTEWDSIDCDGDSITNSREIIEGTDPLDGCSYLDRYFDKTKALPSWEVLDCDNDGISNGEDVCPKLNSQNQSDLDQDTIGDECDDDIDGDSVSNTQEVTDGTDPLDGCSYKQSNFRAWLVADNWSGFDCDGDGILTEDNCPLVANTDQADSDEDGLGDVCDYDIDGDGVFNSTEENDGTDPNDGCSYLAVNQYALNISDKWKSEDCDNDGVSNEDELENGSNPLQEDTDGDGLSDNVDGNPLDPCLPQQSPNYTGFDTSNTMWSTADCDGDGIDNGEEVSNNSDPYNDSFDSISTENPAGFDELVLESSDGQSLNSKSVAVFQKTVAVAASVGLAKNLFIFEKGNDNTWGEIQKIPVPTASHSFGFSIDMYNGLIAITDPGDDTYGASSGAVYIFEKNSGGSWVEKEKLTASDGAAGDAFGSDVAIYNQAIAVSSRSKRAAYIFEPNSSNSWEQKAKIVPSENTANFGRSLALHGNHLVVGAPGSNAENSAYIFERQPNNTWAEQQKLVSPENPINDLFGVDVAIIDDRIVVGANGGNYDEPIEGKAFIFEKIGSVWSLAQNLNASDGNDFNYFGDHVTKTSNRIIASLNQDEGGGVGIYVFHKNSLNNWVETHKLANNLDYGFGHSMDSWGDVIVTISGSFIHIFEPSIASLDADGDGVSNTKEIEDGTDENNPCDFLLANQDTAPTSDWETDDCDQDGSSNGDEISAGTNPLKADTDGDGIADNIDTEPLNPCVPVQSEGYTDYDSTNEIWANADCDQDNTTNAAEISNNTNPFNADTDGDGVTDSNDIAPLDPCLPQQVDGYSDFDTSNTIWSNADCDADGTLNGEELTNGTDPYISDSSNDSCIKITHSDGINSEYFAGLLAISDDEQVLAATASFTDSSGESSKIIYIFNKNTSGEWQEIQKITATDILPDDSFGSALAFAGETLAVGAVRQNNSTGAVYLFDKSPSGLWEESQKLLAPDTNYYKYFGHSISGFDNFLIVGSSRDNQNGAARGAAYVFEKNANNMWVESTKLIASDAANHDQFGISVAMTTNTIVVGALYNNNNVADIHGSAYVFEKDTNGDWTESTKLKPSQTNIDGGYGVNVGIFNNTIVVGAASINSNATTAGAAYVYEKSSDSLWSQVTKLSATNPKPKDLFGFNVKINKDFIACSISSDDENGPYSGSVQIFKKSEAGSWNPMQKLFACDTNEDYMFLGRSIAMADNSIVANASLSSKSKFAFIYELDQPPVTELALDVNVTAISCYGSADGFITATATGGNPPYLYTLETPVLGNTSANKTGQFSINSAGDYIVTVRDDLGVEVSQPISMYHPTPLTLTVDVLNHACENEATGSLSIVAAGGAASYEFSIDNGATFGNNTVFNNLEAGDYSVFVRDTNGCTFNQLVTIATDENCSDFSLPVTNFTIETTSESCASSNNGSILITAAENHNYTAVLSDGINPLDAKDFRTFTSFQDLNSGSYEICIRVEGHPEYEKCFAIQISEPGDLEVDSKIDDSGKTVSLSLKGGAKYFININGTEYSTSENEITLPLSKVENSIEVKTDKKCQGLYEDTLLANYSSISIFPNPVDKGDVNIVLPSIEKNEVLLTLFSQNGIRVMEKMEMPSGRTVKINMDDLPTGVYTIIITTEILNSMRKIVKK